MKKCGSSSMGLLKSCRKHLSSYVLDKICIFRQSIDSPKIAFGEVSFQAKLLSHRHDFLQNAFRRNRVFGGVAHLHTRRTDRSDNSNYSKKCLQKKKKKYIHIYRRKINTPFATLGI